MNNYLLGFCIVCSFIGLQSCSSFDPLGTYEAGKRNKINNINSLSEAEQIKVISDNNGAYISKIEKPSEAVQLAAIKESGSHIGRIKNPSEATQIASVKETWRNLEYIKNPTEKVQILAIKSDPEAINLINKLSKSAENYLKNNYLKANGYEIDNYNFVINNKKYYIWDLDDWNHSAKNISMLGSIEVTVLKAMKKAISQIGSVGGERNIYNRFMMKVKSETGQLYIVNKIPDSIGYINRPHSSVKNHSTFIAYKRAELKRKKERAAEYAKYSGSSSSNSESSGSNSYSQPQPQQRTCTRTVYHTEYAPGNSGRTVQIPRNESYPCN